MSQFPGQSSRTYRGDFNDHSLLRKYIISTIRGNKSETWLFPPDVLMGKLLTFATYRLPFRRTLDPMAKLTHFSGFPHTKS